MAQHDNNLNGDHRDHADSGGGPAAPAVTVQLVAGETLLTVNPVDGSEIQPCPPGGLPARPRKLRPADRPASAADAVAEATAAAARPAPVLERDEERARLRRLLSQGRSVRLTGPAGSGRGTLLDAAAEDVAGLAPDGVIRLDARGLGLTDVLYALFDATHESSAYRPGPEELDAALRSVGAVVLLDGLEFGGAALDALLDATPECAFLFSALPGAPAPPPGCDIAELSVSGLSRPACLELLEHAAGRPLTEQEADWAADVWFASQGLPLAFVQAGALLRNGTPTTAARPAEIVALVAAGLPVAARETLRLAVALGGELPHHSHLPALLDPEQAGGPGADAGEGATVAALAGAGLVTVTGGRRRLAPGVAEALRETAGSGSGSGSEGAAARTAAQHYAWWVAHPSVTAGRVAAEGEVLLAAVQGARRAGHVGAAVLLARAAAPVLAAGPRWNLWERVLRAGQEAARVSGEVAEQAYFQHELGVLAFCTGDLERARSELEASIALRGALADQRGTVAGRRALALVRDGLRAADGGAYAADSRGAVRGNEPAAGAGSAAASGPDATAVTARYPRVDGPADTLRTATVAHSAYAGAADARGRTPARGRRHLVAAGAGALLAVAVDTVVTLGVVSGDGSPDRGTPGPSVAPQSGDGDLPGEEPPGGGGNPQPEGAPAETAPPGTRGPEPGRTGTPGTSRPPEDGSTGGGSGSTGPSPSDSETSTPPGNSGCTDGGSSSSGSGGSGGTTGGSGSGGSGGSDSGGTSDGGTSDGGTSDGGSSGGASDGGASDGGSGSGGTSDGGADGGGTSDGGSGGSPTPSPTSSPTASPTSSGSPSPTATGGPSEPESSPTP